MGLKRSVCNTNVGAAGAAAEQKASRSTLDLLRQQAQIASGVGQSSLLSPDGGALHSA